MKFEENQHYHRRIGEYLDNAHDKWWTIENTEQASTAAKEICSIMEERILVELSKFNSTQDLINAWLNKKYFGITEFQRKEYLALLGVMDMPNYKSL